MATSFLAQPATLNVDGMTIVCQERQDDKPNIYFDNQGRLAGCTLKSAVEWKVKQIFNFSKNSRLVFKNDEIDQVFLGTAGKISVAVKEYQVSNDERQPSFRFGWKNELEAFLSGVGNTFDIEGQALVIETGPEVRITNETAATSIERFLAGSEVTVNVYKSSKTK